MKENELGTSIFWIGAILGALIGLSFLGIWSYHNESIKGAVISFIFFAMIISGVILSRFEIFNMGKWGASSLSFMLGFLLYIYFGSSNNSVVSIVDNSLFASISSQLPIFLEFLMNSIVIPLAEEIFWMIGIPFTLIALLDLIKEGEVFGFSLEFLGSMWSKLIIITIVTGITFMVFHVGKPILSFLIAAFIFRMAMVFAVVGDMEYDFIPFLAILPSFAVGAHIGNNWGSWGFMDGVGLLLSNGAIGIMVLTVFAIIALSAVNYTAVKIMDGVGLNKE